MSCFTTVKQLKYVWQLLILCKEFLVYSSNSRKKLSKTIKVCLATFNFV